MEFNLTKSGNSAEQPPSDFHDLLAGLSDPTSPDTSESRFQLNLVLTDTVFQGVLCCFRLLCILNFLLLERWIFGRDWCVALRYCGPAGGNLLSIDLLFGL